MSANALSALDAGEARELAAHLESCPECHYEGVELQKAAAMLVFDAKPIEPSPRVRENILAAIRAENKKSTTNQRQTGGAQVNEPRVIPFERPSRNVWSPLGSFGAIAATLAFVALLISLLVVWNQKRANEGEVTRLSSQIQRTEAQLQHEREVVALITTPGARMTELAGTKVAPGAHAMIAYDTNGRAMLMAQGLPAPPAGKAYQLWFIMGNKPMAGKVFKTDASGAGTLNDQVPAVALNAAVFAITLEPESGV
ncbi:MAG: anti-sigma factor, partial [bacterium]